MYHSPLHKTNYLTYFYANASSCSFYWSAFNVTPSCVTVRTKGRQEEAHIRDSSNRPFGSAGVPHKADMQRFGQPGASCGVVEGRLAPGGGAALQDSL
jgi:hypothetical protein